MSVSVGMAFLPSRSSLWKPRTESRYRRPTLRLTVRKDFCRLLLFIFFISPSYRQNRKKIRNKIFVLLLFSCHHSTEKRRKTQDGFPTFFFLFPDLPKGPYNVDKDTAAVREDQFNRWSPWQR